MAAAVYRRFNGHGVHRYPPYPPLATAKATVYRRSNGGRPPITAVATVGAPPFTAVGNGRPPPFITVSTVMECGAPLDSDQADNQHRLQGALPWPNEPDGLSPPLERWPTADNHRW